MKFEIGANMHMYLEVDMELEKEEMEEVMYDILFKLQDRVEGLSFTLHEVELNEI